MGIHLLIFYYFFGRLLMHLLLHVLQMSDLISNSKPH